MLLVTNHILRDSPTVASKWICLVNYNLVIATYILW